MRQIISRFPSKCAVCRKPIPEGISILYNPDGKRGHKAIHLDCGTKSAPASAVSVPASRQNAGNVWRDFDSLASYFDAANQPMTQDNARVWEQLLAVTGERWLGVQSHSEVKRVTIEGWTDGVRQMQESLNYLDAPRPRALRRKPLRGDWGDDYDIHAALRGQHDTAWTRRVRQSTIARRNVTLICCISALAKVSSNEMFWRGAAALAITDALTQAGYDVQIIGQTWSEEVYNRQYSDGAGILIKSFTAPTDLPALASTLCLAGMFRHWTFKYKAAHPHYSVRPGMGRTVYAPHPKLLEQYPDALFVPQDCFTLAEAQEFVNKTLESFA